MIAEINIAPGQTDSQLLSPCLSVILSLPGAPVGLHVLEVRDSSVVLLWEPPAFNGRTPVNGYYVDIKEASAGVGCWKAVHEKANKTQYIKVLGMENCLGGVCQTAGSVIILHLS